MTKESQFKPETLKLADIGNAKIAGLAEDLKLDSSRYEWLLTSFYITYITFQWMTLLYRIVPAHSYIAFCVLSWSLIASLQAFAGSFAQMLILRALLGIGEAAFSPGVPFLLSFFFKRDELAFRTGLFISAAPLATSFASSLAWLIIKAGEKIPIAAWRMLFFVEGFPSVIFAVMAWYQIPDSPGTARYLNSREKNIARLRLGRREGSSKHKAASTEKSKLDWLEIREALTDSKCWITAVCQCTAEGKVNYESELIKKDRLCSSVAMSPSQAYHPSYRPSSTSMNNTPSSPLFYFSLSIYPTWMSSTNPTTPRMNHSTLASQALSAPPYLLAFAIVLLTAFLSDRSQNRGHYVIFHALLGASGYVFIAVAGWLRAGSAWRYAGVYPAASGFFSAITLILTWTINNQNSDSKRGTGVAMLNLVGQFGPLLGTRLYPDEDKPYYLRGMTVCGVCMMAVAALAVWLRNILVRENRSLEGQRKPKGRMQEEEGLVGGDGGGEERVVNIL